MPNPSEDNLPIELVPLDAPAPPRLPGEVFVRPDYDAVIDAVLADLFLHAVNCVRAFGDFHLAAAPTPGVEPVLRRLLYDLNYRDFPWTKTRVWMTHEVLHPTREPLGDGLHELVVEQSGMPPAQFHRIAPAPQPAPNQAPELAKRYAATLREHLEWRERGQDRLDVCLMDLSQDGPALGFERTADSDEDLVAWRMDPYADSASVTLALRTVNASRLIALSAIGRDAGKALRAALTDRASPLRLLRPLGGELRWYLDYEACRAAAGE